MSARGGSQAECHVKCGTEVDSCAEHISYMSHTLLIYNIDCWTYIDGMFVCKVQILQTLYSSYWVRFWFYTL